MGGWVGGWAGWVGVWVWVGRVGGVARQALGAVPGGALHGLEVRADGPPGHGQDDPAAAVRDAEVEGWGNRARGERRIGHGRLAEGAAGEAEERGVRPEVLGQDEADKGAGEEPLAADVRGAAGVWGVRGRPTVGKGGDVREMKANPEEKREETPGVRGWRAPAPLRVGRRRELRGLEPGAVGAVHGLLRADTRAGVLRRRHCFFPRRPPVCCGECAFSRSFPRFRTGISEGSSHQRWTSPGRSSGGGAPKADRAAADDWRPSTLDTGLPAAAAEGEEEEEEEQAAALRARGRAAAPAGPAGRLGAWGGRRRGRTGRRAAAAAAAEARGPCGEQRAAIRRRSMRRPRWRYLRAPIGARAAAGARRAACSRCWCL